MTSPYSNPFADKAAPPNPYVAPAYQPFGTPQAGYYRPHRGGVIIALGIIALVMVTLGTALMAAACIPVPFFALAVSIPAWIMGHKDLKAIQLGELDPTGKGLTLAGMIMGIVSTAIAGVFTLIIAFFAILFVIGMIIAVSAGNMR